jgi:hypothetical protein
MTLFGFVDSKTDTTVFARFSSKIQGQYIAAEFDIKRFKKEDWDLLTEGIPIVWDTEKKSLDVVQIKIKD